MEIHIHTYKLSCIDSYIYIYITTLCWHWYYECGYHEHDYPHCLLIDCGHRQVERSELAAENEAMHQTLEDIKEGKSGAPSSSQEIGNTN